MTFFNARSFWAKIIRRAIPANEMAEKLGEGAPPDVISNFYGATNATLSDNGPFHPYILTDSDWK